MRNAGATDLARAVGIDPERLEPGSMWISGAGVAQLVEHQPSKLRVAGSNPVSRSKQTDLPAGAAGAMTGTGPT